MEHHSVGDGPTFFRLHHDMYLRLGKLVRCCARARCWPEMARSLAAAAGCVALMHGARWRPTADCAGCAAGCARRREKTTRLRHNSLISSGLGRLGLPPPPPLPALGLGLALIFPFLTLLLLMLLSVQRLQLLPTYNRHTVKSSALPLALPFPSLWLSLGCFCALSSGVACRL